MKTYFDFEIHSRYARACSPELTIPNIAAWARRKGVGIVGTGDFTHPKWFADICEHLEEDGSGLLRLRAGHEVTLSHRNVRFILSAEISCIYRHNDRTRRIHNLLLAPSIDAVKKIIAALTARGAKLAADGRPIVGMPSKELLRLVLEASPDCMLIPAHVWTPYFGLFGSMSGYDSVEECFEDLSPHVHALETGLSADPEMFWRISKLDRFTLVSCSDAHSLPRIGRECNVLDLAAPRDFTYAELARAIRERDRAKFLATVEYWPEEGRYHYDGHAACGVSLHPDETKKLRGICPKCGKKLTIGVLSRTLALSDRPEGYVPAGAIPGKHFVVLEEIIAAAMGVGVHGKKVQAEYMKLTDAHPEFEILFDLDEAALRIAAPALVAEAILKMRAGQVEITPGYDGEYGKVALLGEKDLAKKKARTLFD